MRENKKYFLTNFFLKKPHCILLCRLTNSKMLEVALERIIKELAANQTENGYLGVWLPGHVFKQNAPKCPCVRCCYYYIYYFSSFFPFFRCFLPPSVPLVPSPPPSLGSIVNADLRCNANGYLAMHANRPRRGMRGATTTLLLGSSNLQLAPTLTSETKRLARWLGCSWKDLETTRLHSTPSARITLWRLCCLLPQRRLQPAFRRTGC